MGFGQKALAQLAVMTGYGQEGRKRSDTYLYSLDGWRAIAILLVMIGHTVARTAPLASITAFGRYGVDVFFALSGLLITSRLLNEFRALGKFDLKGFYLRRFIRILAPAWCYLAVILALEAFGLFPWYPRGLFASVTLWRNFVGMPDHYTTHFWSLCVEEHFYLVWPLLLALIRPRWAWIAAIAGILALAVHRHHLANVLGGESFGMFARTDVRADALLGGCLLALAFDSKAAKARLVELTRPAWLVWALLAAQVYLAAKHPPLEGTLRALLWPAILACTVLHPRRPFSLVLETKPFVEIGRMSYSLYLWQQPFLVAFDGVPVVMPLQIFPLNWLATFGVAYCLNKWLERPSQQWGRRLAPPSTAGREL